MLETPTKEGGCFIATAAFRSPIEPAVGLLRRFRDEQLAGLPGGRAFIQIYYKLSPPLADYIRKRPWLKKVVRAALYPIVLLAAVSLWFYPVAGFLIGFALLVGLAWLALRGPTVVRWGMAVAVLIGILLA